MEISESVFWHWSQKEQLNIMSLADMWVVIILTSQNSGDLKKRQHANETVQMLFWWFLICNLLVSLCYFLSESLWHFSANSNILYFEYNMT